MSRYTGPVCRLCRRETAASKTGEKIKLFLKGDRCLSRMCAVERRGTAPGQKTTGNKSRTKVSEYGRQLREKQKMRRYYGVHETQFRNYFREAARVPGQTGRTFLQLLERRLDNVIYRLNLAQSRRPPDWLEWNDETKTAKVLQAPPREQIDTPVDEQLIVEYYSR